MFEIILSNFNLDKIFLILKSKLKFILPITILAALGMGIYANYTRTSVYMAQTSFYVYSNPAFITDPTVNIGDSDISLAKNLVASYMQILQSNTFMIKLREKTGLPYSVKYLKSNISATSVQNTAVFIVCVYNPSPMDAMTIANAIGDLAPNEITRIVKSGGIEVLDKAELPTVPYRSTSVKKLILFGGLGGFALSMFIFLFCGLLDTTIRNKHELCNIFSIPILGDVPQLPGKKRKAELNRILGPESPFVIKEAYNNIRANMLFTGRGEKCPAYAVTSADVAEGKTLNTINMAISYAQINKKTLLIDADMRRSSMSTMLDVEQIDGLSEYLAGIVTQPLITEYHDNLYIISSGKIPPNPSELLSNARWGKLLENCKMEYDVIFIDLPPVGLVSDALLLSKDTTAYVLIVREKVSKSDREQTVVRQLESLSANICGFVYNGISMKSQDYTYKFYGKEIIS